MFSHVVIANSNAYLGVFPLKLANPRNDRWYGVESGTKKQGS